MPNLFKLKSVMFYWKDDHCRVSLAIDSVFVNNSVILALAPLT